MAVKFIVEVVKGLFGVSDTGTEEPTTASSGTDITVEREAEEESMSADEFETLDESDDDEESEAESEEADTETLEESTDDEETESEETDEQADESEAVPVEEVSGIGPTYSERLADVGTETVADLASADPAAVAEAAEVSESRAEDWITAAEEY